MIPIVGPAVIAVGNRAYDFINSVDAGTPQYVTQQALAARYLIPTGPIENSTVDFGTDTYMHYPTVGGSVTIFYLADPTKNQGIAQIWINGPTASLGGATTYYFPLPVSAG